MIHGVRRLCIVNRYGLPVVKVVCPAVPGPGGDREAIVRCQCSMGVTIAGPAARGLARPR